MRSDTLDQISVEDGLRQESAPLERNEKYPGRNRAVLIVDDNEAFAAGLRSSFNAAGFDVWIHTSYSAALTLATEVRPWLTVTEVKLGAKWVFEVISAFKQLGGRIAIATAYPSVATAIHAVREGAGVYMAKPVTAYAILSGFETPGELPATAWPSLDRTIWEYINQVFVAAGSMSEAARRLRLDRRSLRRMLAKHPPAR